MTGTELVVAPSAHENALDLGRAMHASGLFPDVNKAEQAVVKILAGREYGLGPVASMSGIHIIDGKPSTGSNVLAALVKQSARYDYEVVRMDVTGCVLRFIERRGAERVTLGESSFVEADAKRAGLNGRGNWRKYPQSMYFARALTSGVRTFAPDVTLGVPAYTAEELGEQNTDEFGAPVNAPAAPAETEKPKRTPKPKPEPATDPEPEITDAEVVPDGAEVRTVDATSLAQISAKWLTFKADYPADASIEDEKEREASRVKAAEAWLRFKLTECGVEDPSGPLGEVMPALTLEQAVLLDEHLDAAITAKREATNE